MSEQEPQEHRDAERRAQVFEAMAERIRLNKDAMFGGAFVIFPPETENSIEMLIFNQQEVGVFWAAVKTLAEQAIGTIDQLQRQQGRFR